MSELVSSTMPNCSELEVKHGVTNLGIHVMISVHKIIIILVAPSFEAAKTVFLEFKLSS